MASISATKNGRRTIQFIGPDRKRRSIRLGKCSKRHAEAVKFKVENLVASKLTGHAMDDETARWVQNLEQTFAERLSKTGLIPRQMFHKLGPFLDDYIEGRIDLKPRTIMKLETTRGYLVEFFGVELELRELTAGGADSWRLKCWP